MDTAALKSLASQLSCPNGDMGKLVADNMQVNNFGMIRNAIQNLQLQNEERVVELGHGDGAHIADVLTQAESLQYFGLEISTLMHQVAIDNTKVFEKSVHFEMYDGVSIPLPKESIDALFTVNTIYFWEDRKALLQSIFDVLKLGGRFCITFADKEFMQQLPFVQYGFQLVDVEMLLQELLDIGFVNPQIDTQNETVISQSGEAVNRKYYTIRVRK